MITFAQPSASRRDALKSLGSGFGYLAFAAMAAEQARAENPLAPKRPHFIPRAKRVIFMAMRGAPSHVDTFDYKPGLTTDNGKTSSYGARRGGTLLGSPWEFKPHGESGLPISSLFPHLAKQADELCLINSMHTDQPNHPQAFIQMHTGNFQFVRPALGAWTLYGLGTENASLPGFIALNPPVGTGGSQNYGSSFLPAIYQGTQIGADQRRARFFRQQDEPKVPNIENSRLDRDLQRIQLDLVQDLNRDKLTRDVHQPEVEGVIESFELAFRMQDAMPDLMDVSVEKPETLAMYGIGDGATDSFGRQCLLARRFVEAGVRFVEISHGNWDHHRNLRNDMEARCGETDLPIAGLIADLKQRNLLDDTLIIWAGEFGRTPHAQNGDGRDHNHRGYTTWMAGGGVRGGLRYGATDEHGYEAVEGKVHIHDWHATILHLLGLDHEQLTYRYAGRDFRLTDVYGRVVKDILA